MFTSISTGNITIVSTTDIRAMKIKNKIIKFLCCCSVTLGARLVGFVGVAISATLASVLLRDKSRDDYRASRKTATLLGLDWQHFHQRANATATADPDGYMISIIVIFYSILYLITSLSLIFATISRLRWMTVPWLLCESLGCISKVAAVICHSIYVPEQFNKNFVIGSTAYVVIMSWWWLVVFIAQITWRNDDRVSLPNIPLTTYVRSDSIDYNIPLENEINNETFIYTIKPRIRTICTAEVLNETSTYI